MEESASGFRMLQIKIFKFKVQNFSKIASCLYKTPKLPKNI